MKISDRIDIVLSSVETTAFWRFNLAGFLYLRRGLTEAYKYLDRYVVQRLIDSFTSNLTLWGERFRGESKLVTSDGYRMVILAHEVIPEVIEVAVQITDDVYPEGPINWGRVWTWLDGTYLSDKTRIDLGVLLPETPAMRKIQREVLKRRAEKD